MQAVDTLVDKLKNEYVDRCPREVAQYCECITPESAAKLLPSFSDKDLPNVWFYIGMSAKQSIFNALPASVAIRLLNKIDVAPSASLLINLSSSEREKYLSALDPVYANYIREFISYPSDSAATMMDKVSHVYQEDITVSELFKKLKDKQNITTSCFYLTDVDNIISGCINIQDLLVTDVEQTLSSISTRIPIVVSAFTSRRDVLEVFESAKVESLPVVDSAGHVIGIIYAAKIFDELKDEITSDIQTMVGASPNETALSPSLFAVKLRLPWLLINLVTAFVAASVVGVFEGTIEKITALAVLLPVVAGQSGNAGAQALAVCMRGLAIREFAVTQYLKVVRKEVVVGLVTGVLVAVVCGIGVFIWSKNYILGIVLALSMAISVSVACVSGVLVPIVLKQLNQDPAQSSSIILTTITDVIGFFSFLGIATLMLSML